MRKTKRLASTTSPVEAISEASTRAPASNVSLGSGRQVAVVNTSPRFSVTSSLAAGTAIGTPFWVKIVRVRTQL